MLYKMNKRIDKKFYQIVYQGKKEELTSILECLVKKIQKELLEDLDPVSIENNQISLYPSQRIYYSLEKIVYLPNTSNKKFMFPILLKNSLSADVEFLNKNPQYNLKVQG